MSALVTLFANILQNPQDVRVRTDVKLMNQVVSFLSLLPVTEEHSGVKRVLGICSEFERIAKFVLEKGEKDSHSRRKRKSNKDQDGLPSLTPRQTPQSQNAPHHPLPKPSDANLFNTDFVNDFTSQNFNPSLNSFSSPLSNGDISISADFNPSSGDFSNLMSPPQIVSPNFDLSNVQHHFSSDGSPLLNAGSFQQPFVPQDLWQMPMTLEWDWADMTSDMAGPSYPGFDGVNTGEHHH